MAPCDNCAGNERLGPKLEALLGCAQSSFADCGVPVCRAFLSTAVQPPWDVCCECNSGVGQLWVSVDTVTPLLTPTQGAGPVKCASWFEANVYVGILRCALTVGDNGEIPDPDALSQEALEVLQDRLIIQNAVRCCYGAANDPDDWTLGAWTSLGPQGGCVGGRLNLTLRFVDPKCV